MPDQTPRPTGPNRREFLKTSAFVGAAALGSGGCSWAVRDAEAAPFAYDVNDPEHFIHSVCLQCHTACPIKVKLNEGAAVKIDGNPYGIQTLLKPLAYETPLRSAGRVDGKLCPKGQSGLQSHYDPYRITKVLKRAGKRGEDRWETIPFRQAIREIVEGGKLFRHVAGEADREVPGLKDLFRLRDPDVAARMAEDAKAVAQGTMTVEQFKRAHADHLDVLIDPDHPDFGPTNNQFVFQAGRIEHGRKELSQRWLRDAFGSINWYEHTTICEQSHHIAYQQMSNQYADGAWTGGNTHFKPDIYNAEFIIFFGTGAFEANFGPPMLAELVTDRLVTGDLDMVVVDPRHSKTAAKAWQWVPVVPGTDAALAYGLIRWIIDHEGYDAAFLRHANKAAADAGGEATWTNAPYLVRIEADGPGALLRAAEVGLGGEHEFVVVQNGRPVAVDPNDTARPVDGDLFHSGTVGGVKVKTAFQLIADYARSKSVAEWAEACGVPAEQVEAVARKFARHGKKATAELYRGAVQHTNGYYNAQAIITLNLLAGNVDWKGGLSKGGGH
ncbi:MAG: molybdopterin-dependent oxidoreductase, partial [Rhodothermales bacterium]